MVFTGLKEKDGVYIVSADNGLSLTFTKQEILIGLRQAEMFETMKHALKQAESYIWGISDSKTLPDNHVYGHLKEVLNYVDALPTNKNTETV